MSIGKLCEQTMIIENVTTLRLSHCGGKAISQLMLVTKRLGKNNFGMKSMTGGLFDLGGSTINNLILPFRIFN